MEHHLAPVCKIETIWRNEYGWLYQCLCICVTIIGIYVFSAIYISKGKSLTDIQIIKNYAQDGAKYLATLGFDKRFCKICEEVNRYSGSTPREPESDILELVDNFGGLVLDRPERRGFPIDEALVLTEYRNLKGYNNRFMEQFKYYIRTELDAYYA